MTGLAHRSDGSALLHSSFWRAKKSRFMRWSKRERGRGQPKWRAGDGGGPTNLSFTSSAVEREMKITVREWRSLIRSMISNP